VLIDVDVVPYISPESPLYLRYISPISGAVLIDVDVGHVAGPVPVLHSGNLGAQLGLGLGL